MAVNVSILDVSSGFNLSSINANFVALQAALQDAISRSGVVPNGLAKALDMGNQSIINADAVNAQSLNIQGIPILNTLPGGTIRGAWVTARAYVVGDLITGDGEDITYIANTAHTSGTFITDKDTNKFWTLFAIAPSTVQDPEFFSGDGATVAFALSKAPGNERNALVFVDGVFQQHDTFGISGITLTFTTAPATGTGNIAVWYMVGVTNLVASSLGAVLKTDFNANTIMSADLDDAPLPLTVSASTLIGRKATGGTAALTATEALTVLGVEAGATADQTGTEIKTAYEGNADTNAFLDAEKTKLAGLTATVLSGKNKIINGNFDIWQRGTSFIPIATGSFGTDRFAWSASSESVVSMLRSTSVPNGLSDFSLQIDVTTPDLTIGAVQFSTIKYVVEGHDMMSFGFGTVDATDITLSFQVKSSKTGIHCVSFRNDAPDRSYIAEYTVNVADVWETKTITLSGDTAGLWLTDTGRGMQIQWCLAVGTTFQTPPNVWTTGSFLGTSNQVNVTDSVANNFHISQVQLEVGSTATPFERRLIGEELSLAQRYYHEMGIGMIAYEASATSLRQSGTFPVEMRVAPTIALLTTTPSYVISNQVETGVGSTIDSAGAVNTRGVSHMRVIGFTTIPVSDTGSPTTDILSVDAEL